MKSRYKDSLIFFISLIVFKLALECSYFFILSNVFSSVGYVLDINITRYFFSWLLYVLSFLLLKPRFNYVKDYFFLTAVLGVIAPILVLWGLDYNRDNFPVAITFLAIFLIYFSYIFFFNNRSIKLPLVKNGINISITLSFILIVFLLIWYPISGARYNLSFANVYEYRRANAELSAFGFLAYLTTWIYKVFAVFLLAYSLLKKRYIFSIILFITFILFYMANTHKSVFFTPFLVLSFWYYFNRYNNLYVVPLGFSALILSSIISYYFLGDVWMTALFPNRVFEIPAHLTFKYFEFFQNNDFVLFSNSFLKSFIEYPYDRDLANLISNYNGDPYSAANNGFISSAYAQGGVTVVFSYSIIIGFILSVIDKMVKKNEIKAWFALVILMVPLRDFLISIDFLTTLLTGGMIWGLILIYMVRNKSNNMNLEE